MVKLTINQLSKQRRIAKKQCQNSAKKVPKKVPKKCQ